MQMKMRSAHCSRFAATNHPFVAAFRGGYFHSVFIPKKAFQTGNRIATPGRVVDQVGSRSTSRPGQQQLPGEMGCTLDADDDVRDCMTPLLIGVGRQSNFGLYFDGGQRRSQRMRCIGGEGALPVDRFGQPLKQIVQRIDPCPICRPTALLSTSSFQSNRLSSRRARNSAMPRCSSRSVRTAHSAASHVPWRNGQSAHASPKYC